MEVMEVMEVMEEDPSRTQQGSGKGAAREKEICVPPLAPVHAYAESQCCPLPKCRTRIEATASICDDCSKTRDLGLEPNVIQCNPMTWRNPN